MVQQVLTTKLLNYAATVGAEESFRKKYTGRYTIPLVKCVAPRFQYWAVVLMIGAVEFTDPPLDAFTAGQAVSTQNENITLAFAHDWDHILSRHDIGFLKEWKPGGIMFLITLGYTCTQ